MTPASEERNMASEERLPWNEKEHDDLANPFIAFRRFADEQMSNLMRSIFGLSLPSEASPSSSDRAFQEYQTWLQGDRALRQHVDCEGQKAEQIMDVLARAYKDTVQEQVQKDSQDAKSLSKCPYSPANRGRPQLDSYEHEPSTVKLGSFSDEFSSVPPAYLLYSPYSPFYLDNDQSLCNRGMRWKEAFKDLLAIQNADKRSSNNGQNKICRGHDWARQVPNSTTHSGESYSSSSEAIERETGLSSLSKNGKHPGQDADVKLAQSHEANNNEDANSDDEVTELDLYEHFFGTQGYLGERISSKPLLPSQSERETNEKPSILSTLTTTERKTLQDGTIHTKVVLKKRFSDGREESTETLHTQNPMAKPECQAPTKLKYQHNNMQPLQPVEKESSRKGWFWS